MAHSTVSIDHIDQLLDRQHRRWELQHRAGDEAIATVGTLSLAGGVQTVTFADGDARVRVAYGAPRTYFVALQIAAGAPFQAVNDFRVTHLTQSSSSAEDAAADIRLSLEFVVNVGSGAILFPPRVVSVS